MLVLASLSGSAAGERVEAVSIWDDADALAAYDTGDEHARIGQALSPLAAPPATSDYEVAQSAGISGGTVARFISARLHPGNLEMVVSLFENIVMHAATSQQGFRRGLLLVDRANDNAISIGLWQSEADMHASERTGYLAQQIGNFTHIVAVPIAPETLVVAVEE